MDNLDFSEEEIQEQLAILGYKNIPKHRLRDFKRDLDELIRHGEWKTFASPTQINSTTSQPSPPAYTKEKVGQSCFKGSGEGFFLHAADTDHERPVLTACQNCDSYAQHSVAPKLQLPPGAPTRLWVEPDPEDTLHPPLTDSYTSSPDTRARRFIKRKVLRKHKGQSLVCDESVYSEDSAGAQVGNMYKMYDARRDEGSDRDRSSLSSSFWSDGEKQEDEEEVQIERGVDEGDNSLREASEEEKREPRNQANFTTESSEDGSNDEEEEEEQVATERRTNEGKFTGESSDDEEEEEFEGEVNEEDSKPGTEADDSFWEASDEERPEQINQGKFTGEESEDGSNEEEEEVKEEGEGEGEEQVAPEEIVNEEDSKPGSEADDSFWEASEEEKPGLNDEGKFTGEESEDGTNEEEEEDDEEEQKEEEQVTPEEVVNEEDSKPGTEAEDSFWEASEGKFTGEESEDGCEEHEGENCSSSSSSPAPSLMTSGYGTYRPEEQEGGEDMDDHTITEFDQDSRGDLSEARDDEDDDRSLSSFGWFDVEAAHVPDCKPEANVGCGPREEVDVTGGDEERAEESETNDVTDERSEQQRHHHHAAGEEGFSRDERFLEDGGDHEDEEPDLREKNNVERQPRDEEESEEPDESWSNGDIKFIDSKVDFSRMTYEEMFEEWEGNLRQKKDAASCLEERLAELHLSAPERRNSEAENEDVTDESDAGGSSEADGTSLSAFHSYIRGMSRTRSAGDLRPKPKSFIRPAMSQQTTKKTDPVAKYFQYKQLWEMFKLPGEKDRRSLRWEIKERLAYQPPPPKPRRVHVPNTYVVPTEKKRSALRWEIRSDLANGLLPHKFSYRL